MKLLRTVKIKLDVDKAGLLSTFNEYASCFNYVCEIGWESKDSNGVSLHNKTYRVLRKQFPNMPSQLVISARTKATESLVNALRKLKKGRNVSCPKMTKMSMRLDARTFNIWLDRKEVSFSTNYGRMKCPINIPNYFLQYMSWKRTSADLMLRQGKIYLHIGFEKDFQDIPQNNNVIGVDRGMRKLVVTSNKFFFSGGKVKHISNKYYRLRKALQSKGTKSAKRHLAKIKGKENRFKTDVNHQVSKRIVESIPEGTTLVLENLKHIRTTTKQRKEQRREFHSWAFNQLEQFLTYKAQAKGINIVYVHPANTSKQCSKCGHISSSNRIVQSIFKCKQCRYSLNADLNAAINIRQKYLNGISYSDRASVNKPNVLI